MARVITHEQKKIDVSPVLSSRERLLLWQKAKGMWRRRISNPIDELQTMRQTWSKKISSRRT